MDTLCDHKPQLPSQSVGHLAKISSIPESSPESVTSTTCGLDTGTEVLVWTSVPSVERMIYCSYWSGS